jgi:membrane associated rhomboid family serine protease
MLFFLPTRLRQSSGSEKIPAANALLIAANVLIFVCGGFWTVRSAMPVGILLYGFSHFNLWHLAANMLFLWVFGNPVNRRLGNGYYLACYLGATVAVGLAGLFLGGNGAGSSAAVFAIMTVAFLLLPAVRVEICYLAVLPVTLLLALFSRPVHWLFWIIRWGTVAVPCYWCLVLVPLQQLWELFWSGWNWTNAAHLLGMVCGVVLVLLLPTAITMPSRPR